jgi:hypothetical protein
MMMSAVNKPAHFVYVYVLYYYDPDETELHERLQQVQPVVCATLARAMITVRMKTALPLQEINKDTLWRIGNYWIDRQPIIPDHDNPGLEHEIAYWSPVSHEIAERIALPE